MLFQEDVLMSFFFGASETYLYSLNFFLYTPHGFVTSGCSLDAELLQEMWSILMCSVIPVLIRSKNPATFRVIFLLQEYN